VGSRAHHRSPAEKFRRAPDVTSHIARFRHISIPRVFFAPPDPATPRCHPEGGAAPNSRPHERWAPTEGSCRPRGDAGSFEPDLQPASARSFGRAGIVHNASAVLAPSG